MKHKRHAPIAEQLIEIALYVFLQLWSLEYLKRPRAQVFLRCQVGIQIRAAKGNGQAYHY